jgi:hypothetical protein
VYRELVVKMQVLASVSAPRGVDFRPFGDAALAIDGT